MRVSIDVSSVPANPAGAGRYIVELTRRLAAFDDVQLVVIARSDDDRWKETARGAEVLRRAPSKRPLRLVWEQVRLPGILDDIGVDVHVAPHYTMPERARVPVVVTIHDMTFFDHPEWHERKKVRLFRRAIGVATRRARALICVSRYTDAKLRDRFGDVRSTVIPLAVDSQRFDTTGAGDEQMLAAHGIDGDFVAFVGTIEPRKDVPTLVAAFDRVAEDYEGLRLVIVGGNGWGTAALDDALAAMGHRDRVVMPGYLADDAVPALLRSARLVVYPSLEEGFGLPALEALACGAPLVTTRGTVMEEVVDGAAELFTPGSVDELEAALRRLLADDSASRALADAGPPVAARYSWDANARAHVDLLRSIAGG